MSGYFITGTDTDVGKTVAAAWAVLQLGAAYWKPVQSGLADGETDSAFVHRVAALPDDRILPCRFELEAPLSPDQAAKLEGAAIHLGDFTLPAHDLPLVVEGAGGLLVPLNGTEMMIDLMGKLALPVIVVARSGLGTINHTLLTLNALRDAGVAVSGVILNGPPMPENRAAIERFGNVRILAELPLMVSVEKQALLAVAPLVPVDEWALIS